MSSLSDIRTRLEQEKGKKFQIEKSILNTTTLIATNKKSLIRHEKARELIREAEIKTKESIAFNISEITSLALEAVFDDPYTLEVEFVQRRNKTECDLFFSRDGNRVSPMDASGGGAVDIASFALRIASWSMMHPRLRNTIILDEPMKNLSKDMQEKASAMLKQVSKKLGIQFIIVTHEETLSMYADKVFMTTKNRKGISKVSVIEQEDEAEYSSIQINGKSKTMRRTK